jgi:riboflavin kinase/FMN adenylyltransferase
MRLLFGTASGTVYRGGYVSIGNFDGVHRGHQAMLDQLRRRAESAGVSAVVLTFDPHPAALLRPHDVPPLITTLSHRAELLAGYGVDFVIALPVDHALLQMTAEQFFRSIVVDQLAARGLVEGPNFFFGHNRAGNVTVLKHLCSAAGLTLDVVGPVTVGEQLVSSSVIRSLLLDGDVDDAVELLGHPYRLTGIVGKGAQRGRLIGFPTANLTQVATVVPGDGVYGGNAFADGQNFLAAVNIGPNPTFGESQPKIEVHLLDFQGNLYGRTLDVDLRFRVRDVKTFESVEALRHQLAQDVARLRQRLMTTH